MRSVYVVRRWADHEGSSVLYASPDRAAALRFAEEWKSNPESHWGTDGLTVESWRGKSVRTVWDWGVGYYNREWFDRKGERKARP